LKAETYDHKMGKKVPECKAHKGRQAAAAITQAAIKGRKEGGKVARGLGLLSVGGAAAAAAHAQASAIRIAAAAAAAAASAAAAAVAAQMR
jgi:hypothetical protein